VGEVIRCTDKLGNDVVLTDEDIARIAAKRGDDVGSFLNEIRGTLEAPTVVYKGRFEDSRVFYGKDRLSDDSLYRGCYIAVIVRYSSHGGSVRTVYFPFNIAGNLGEICYIDPKLGR
jgi:hypothetical protein